MSLQSINDDRNLVQHCLSGSRKAWDDFYVRFVPLVRKAVQKHGYGLPSDTEDVVQDVFLALHSDLHRYDSQYRLSQFVWIVSKQVCIDHHRKWKASKRNGRTVPVDHHDSGQEGYLTVESTLDPPEDELERSQQKAFLKAGFRTLGEKCKEILRLRYLEEMPFKEIASMLGANKKSLAVQAGRCLDELRAQCAAAERQRPYSHSRLEM